MADKAQGSISFTPIVDASDNDSDTIQAIHHDIKGTLGGEMVYTCGANDRWYYAPNVIVTEVADKELICTAANPGLSALVGASGSHTDSSEAAGSDCHFTDSASDDIRGDQDDVKFLFIKNTATSDTSGTAATRSVYMVLDNGTVTYNNDDAIEIPAGEAWMGKINTLVSNIIVRTGEPNNASQGTGSVRCTVAAIIDDGGH
tara:strand:- start:363 stop:968 length:606 start_codon:yes stop_codon:yes gene_type:complete